MSATKGSFTPQHRTIFDAMEPSNPYTSFANETNLSTQADDTELSIFDAQKYFEEINDRLEIGNTQKHSHVLPDSTGPQRLSSSSSSTNVHGRNFQTHSFRSYVAPTASSESSWNSHTGLLSNPPGSIPVSLRDPLSEQKRASGSPRWQLFRSKCPCLGKKSISVDEKLSSEPRSPPPMNNQWRIQVNDHAPRKAANIAVCDSKQEKLVTQEKLYNDEMRKSTPNSQHRFSPEVENLFPSQNGSQRSSIVAGRPFSDATTAGFTFPILKASISSATTLTTNSSPSPPIKKLLNGLAVSSPSPINSTIATTSLPLPEDLPRDSLEVFQPLDAAAFSRHKNQIPIQQAPKNQFFTIPPPRVAVLGRKDGLGIPFTADNDDAESDASSDLFEIESFSTLSTSLPNRQRDSLDEARPRFSTNTCNALGIRYNNSATTIDDEHDQFLATTPHVPMECAYEPSEASIAWSVTTAEGTPGDRRSVATNYSISASDVEEFTRLQLRLHKELELSGNGGGQNGNLAKRRVSNGGLLSCRCEKAVSVGPNPVNVKLASDNGNCGQGQGHNRGPAAANTPSLMPPPATTVAGGPRSSLTLHANGRTGTGNGKPPISKNSPPSHPTRLSMTFAT